MANVIKRATDIRYGPDLVPNRIIEFVYVVCKGAGQLTNVFFDF